MDTGIAGRTGLVLGGAGGLGSAVGRSLAREGVRVALGDRNPDRLDAVVRSIRDDGGEAMALPWELSDRSVVDEHVGRIERVWGPVEILVNNTGGPPPGKISGISTSAWTEAFESMVLPVIAITDRVLPAMRSAGWGRIVTSASSGLVSPIPNLGVSNSLRSTLLGWSKTLASEEAAHGITVNILIPGRIATKRTQLLDERRAERDGVDVETVRAASIASIPARRYGRADEYGAVATFLASATASYITGSTIRVDGGYITSS